MEPIGQYFATFHVALLLRPNVENPWSSGAESRMRVMQARPLT
jgi:hypothetical protein